MDKVTININGNVFEMQHITLGLWLEIAKVNTEITKGGHSDVEHFELYSKLFQLVFGIAADEVAQMDFADIQPTYHNIWKALNDLFVSKLDKKNTEVTTTT